MKTVEVFTEMADEDVISAREGESGRCALEGCALYSLHGVHRLSIYAFE